MLPAGTVPVSTLAPRGGPAANRIATGREIVLMWATWTNTPSGAGACVVHLNPSVWTNWRVDDHAFQWFCDTMTHEVGHFLGNPDSGQSSPRSITRRSTPNRRTTTRCRSAAIASSGSRTSA